MSRPISLLDELKNKTLHSRGTGTLSDHCLVAMNHYYDNMTMQYGSESDVTKDRTGLEMTNCIIFVLNVLKYGYYMIGKDKIVDGLRREEVKNGLGKRQPDRSYKKGGLAGFLVDNGWKAHYWNPDVYKPRDKGSEHRYSFTEATKRKPGLDNGEYYGIPLNGLVVGYNKTTKNYHQQVIDGYVIEDCENEKTFEKFKKEKFCLGICRGGLHMFFVSAGKIWEQHWDQYMDEKGDQKLPTVKKGAILVRDPVTGKDVVTGGTPENYRVVKMDVVKRPLGSGKADAWLWDIYHETDIFLYEKHLPFEDYAWLSGLLLTPPDSVFISRNADAVLRATLKCTP
jgi:hypothetical protein